MIKALHFSIVDVKKNKLLFCIVSIIVLGSSFIGYLLYNGYESIKKEDYVNVNVFKIKDGKTSTKAEIANIVNFIYDNHTISELHSVHAQDGAVSIENYVIGFDAADENIKAEFLAEKEENNAPKPFSLTKEEAKNIKQGAFDLINRLKIINTDKFVEDLNNLKLDTIKVVAEKHKGVDKKQISLYRLTVTVIGLMIVAIFIMLVKIFEYIAYKMYAEYQIHLFYGAKNKDIILRNLFYSLLMLCFIELLALLLYRRIVPLNMHIPILIQVIFLFISNILILYKNDILYRKEKNND